MSVVASPTAVSCFGANNGSISVASYGGTGTHTYSLNGVNYQSLNQFTGLYAGTYNVYVKDVTSCVKTAIVTVSQAPALAASMSVLAATCNGQATGSITATISGGTPTYSYSLDGIIFQSSNLFSNLISDTFNLTVKDANNCLLTSTVLVGQPSVRRFLTQQRKQQHARTGEVAGHARAQREAGVHAAVLSIACDVNQVVAVEHGNERNFLCAHRQPLQRGLHDARQARRFQVRLTQPHDLRGEPKQFAIGRHKTQVGEGEQVATCRRARQAAALTRLRGRQARVVFVKGLQHGETFVQTGDPVFFIHACGVRQKSVHNVCRGKPVMRSMIAQKRSLIAHPVANVSTDPAFPIKLHTSKPNGWCAADFITPSHQTKAQFQTQRGDIHE